MTQFVELHNFVIFRILQSIVPLLVHQQSPCVSLHNTYWVYTFVYYSIPPFPQTPSGCVFGGYTDVSWSSRFKRGKFASSPKSFLFTLVNPSNTPPSKFEINQPAYAINNHPRLVPMVQYNTCSY